MFRVAAPFATPIHRILERLTTLPTPIRTECTHARCHRLDTSQGAAVFAHFPESHENRFDLISYMHTHIPSSRSLDASIS